MSFFADFVGGAAKTLLDERKVALAEKLKQEEEERRRNFQLDLEQRAAERQHARDLMNAETQRLERDERRAERKEDQAFRREESDRSLAMRARELAESRAGREDYRKSQAEEKDRAAAERAAQTFMSGLVVEGEDGKISPRPGVDPVSIRNAMSYYEELMSQGNYKEAMKALRGIQQAMALGDPLPTNTGVSSKY